MKYHVEVHGCQMNVSDAERVATVCEKNGYQKTSNWREADLVMYLSCSIKQKAEDKLKEKLTDEQVDTLKSLFK